ncbi:MAG: hypothetical protein ACI8X5_000326 [Planctomycetota bacterium]|jgi:hypothetical protein
MTFPTCNAGRKLTNLIWVPTLGLPLLLAGCSGGSTSADAIGSSGGAFQLASTSIENGTVWQINRPIKLTFTAAVDFSTVNLNTISIQELSGAPAVGEFVAVSGDPKSVLFQPVCPALEDFSDAGLKPGGVNYQLNVPMVSSGSNTVYSTGGKPLSLGWTRTFSTPTSAALTDIFLDPVPGPALPLIIPGSGSLIRAGNTSQGADEIDTYFQLNTDGSGSLPLGFLVSNNFYSDPATQVGFHVRFDQPVNPKSENINSNRLRMEFSADGFVWNEMTTEVFLESNCVGTGASVLITPVGILPQGSAMRIVVTTEFEDLVGDRNLSQVDQLMNMTADSVMSGGSPVETADEVLDEYLDIRFQDATSSLGFPAADWGGGSLEASFGFDGTGGPGGTFDLKIPENQEVVFDTTSTIFTGGPNFVGTTTQLALGGRLDVRNLWVPASATLRIQGPNAAKIVATGFVRIEGVIKVNGGNAKSVFTLNTPVIPETGGAGQAGGGAGGTGSFLTSVVTPRGGNGQGAFGAAGFGGEGGEAGWTTLSGANGINRRAAGGGGGVFGKNQEIEISTMTGPVLCLDQAIFGLDAESGFPGHDNALSSQGNHIPYGGHAGPGPFGISATGVDDFFGIKVSNEGVMGLETLIRGELTRPTGGSGGGAGGDGTFVTEKVGTYPPPYLQNNHQDKGAGGGGGAGAVSLLALGDIRFEGSGRIEAIGGFGNGGENTSGVNRVGGGSGGGSGGHVILQTAGRIDLTMLTAQNTLAINARGGQGGAGAGNNGGVGSTSGETTTLKDALHIGTNNGNGVDNPWVVLNSDCYDEVFVNGQTQVIRAAGGDGGPGLVQFHVGNLTDDVLYSGSGNNVETLRNDVQPVPHGYNAVDEAWDDHLLPDFGSTSVGQSKWISIGDATVQPGTQALGVLGFLWDGTDTGTGRVESTGGVVDSLPALLTAAAPILDVTDPTDYTLLLDAASLAGGSDGIYLFNPNLVRNFALVIGAETFYVASATFNEATDDLVLVVDSSGSSLTGATGAVELRPRYLGISTAGDQDSLTSNAYVQVDFDLMAIDPDNEANISTTGFVPNLAGEDLNALGIDPSHIIRFMRYRVTFDITQGGAPLSANSPRPSVDFLRMPFRF